jgi:hypothetical protein
MNKKKMHTIRKGKKIAKKRITLISEEHRQWMREHAKLSVTEAWYQFQSRFDVVVPLKVFVMSFLRNSGKMISRGQKTSGQKIRPAQKKKTLRLKKKKTFKRKVLREKISFEDCCAIGQNFLLKNCDASKASGIRTVLRRSFQRIEHRRISAKAFASLLSWTKRKRNAGAKETIVTKKEQCNFNKSFAILADGLVIARVSEKPRLIEVVMELNGPVEV